MSGSHDGYQKLPGDDPFREKLNTEKKKHAKEETGEWTIINARTVAVNSLSENSPKEGKEYVVSQIKQLKEHVEKKLSSLYDNDFHKDSKGSFKRSEEIHTSLKKIQELQVYDVEKTYDELTTLLKNLEASDIERSPKTFAVFGKGSKGDSDSTKAVRMLVISYMDLKFKEIETLLGKPPEPSSRPRER